MAVAALLVVGVAWFAVRVPFSSDILRRRVISTLEDRLDADVELGELTLQVFPRFRAMGRNLVVRHHGRRDVPPLFTIPAFTVDASLLGLWRRHVERVQVEGLVIQISRRPADAPDDPGDDAEVTPADDRHVADGRQVVVDVLEAPGSQLVILPRRTDRPPKVWNLHELRVEGVSANTSMSFQAVLTNAVPPGFIATDGSFGPWHIDDPGHTPVKGRFAFDDADLGVFKGIDGTLSSSGTYDGSLERIDVRGTTNTPDFSIRLSGHTVPLETTYHAIVDGTSGDTTLEEVHASFLQTTLTARGGVYGVDGAPGRIVTLDVTSEQGRLEDYMRLAVGTPKPPMTGAISLETKFELPPGDRDVVDKLRLSGRFAIEGGRFTDASVQERINTLSRRASGKPSALELRASSSFAGDFRLADGVLSLPRLTFDVPGAVVDLNGRYSLRDETMAFAGELVMDARLSQTTTGWRSFLLRAVDPLFRRNGRTVIPLRITGTRNEPDFGMDMGRVFSRRPARRVN